MSSKPQTPTILIVDDDKIMGELLIALLTLKGYDVTHAHSGAEALEIVQQPTRKFDVILCDIHMPGLRGGELATALAASRESGMLPADTLLLGMSGSSPKAKDAGPFDAFLRKPFSVEDLASAIEEARNARSRIPASGTKEPLPASPAEAKKSAHSASTPPLDDRTFSQLRSQLEDGQLRQLYEMTLTDVRARLESMAACAQRGDEASVRRDAHAIKGSCGMVGALELQELATATEGGSALNTSVLADFAAACQRLQRMLDDRFQRLW